ncbi:MAG: hypothetical protein LUH42_05475 [Oscillospiraceae bacterium]|nr:hypothetical protein [Oscillospiraceae bacterium]
MAFLPYSYDDGQPKPFEYYPVSGSASIYVGQALVLDGGQLVPSDAPDFISMCERESPAAGEYIPVSRIAEDVIYEAPLGAAADITPGMGGTVSIDGLTVSADGGETLVILSADSGEAGDLCRVRFVQP